MKVKDPTLALILLFLSSFLFHAYCQQDLNSVNNLSTYCDSLVVMAGQKRIVALGEGTHGTREFNEIRTVLTQKLIKEQGFNYILFESNYGGAADLNERLKEDTLGLGAAMKQDLISIWQTSEIQNLLKWTVDHNKQKPGTVKIGGIDYAELNPTFRMVEKKLSTFNIPRKVELLNELGSYISFQDELWNKTGEPKFKFDRKRWLSNGMKAYQIINSLQEEVERDLNVNKELKTALLNLKLGFEPIYVYNTKRKEASRDSCMAEMIKSILVQDPNAKVIIWAHNVHTANQPVYKGSNGGGMGEYVKRNYPKEYFSIATLTSTGTFSGTTGAIPTRFNKFSTIELENPIDGSLEKMLGQKDRVIFTKTDKSLPDEVKMRFVGFGTNSGPNTFTVTKPKDLFDAIIYLADTNASQHF